MPADDLVLNVKQIAGYTEVGSTLPTDALLLQRGGLGGPYQSISPEALVGTALSGTNIPLQVGQPAPADASGGQVFTDAVVTPLGGWFGWNAYDAGGELPSLVPGLGAARLVYTATGFVFQAWTGAWTNGVYISPLGQITINSGQTIVLGRDPVGGLEAATAQWVLALRAASVTSFMGRTGAIVLNRDDIILGGGAPIASPYFVGCPRGPTPDVTSNSSRLATTAYVQTAIAAALADEGQGFAPLDSPNFTGVPTAPTAPQGSADGQLATTAFVTNAVAESTAGVASFNGRTGVVTLVSGDVTAAGGALLASPAFTGTPSAPTQPSTDNSTRLATTAFVVAVAAPLASPAFTGVPTAPTAAPSTSTTQLATTAFVTAAIAAGMAGTVTTFNGRSGAVNLIGNDISAAGGALLASPAFTGAPTAPTAAPSTSNTQLATCAFVMAAVATGGGVLTFNGRAGAVTLTAADLSAVGGALLSSPAFTNLPTAPTAGPGTNTTQLATCAFVMAAIAAGTAGVASFNGRTGAVTLIATDVTTVLPASTTTPAMNGAASPGAQAAWARGDHIHPVDTSRYAATNPSNFQTAAQVTASLAAYLPLSGGTMTGDLSIQSANMALAQPAAGTTLTLNYMSNTANALAALQWQPGTNAIALINGVVATNLTMDGSTNLTFNTAAGTAIKPGGGPWAATSDARIKTVLGEYAQGLDEVLALRPVVYRYKGNDRDPDDAVPTGIDQRQHIGLVAQEVEPIFPEMVTARAGFIDGVEVEDLRTLDTGPLVFALVNAIKTLATRVAALEAA
jgi:hypothetical protein